MIADFVAANSGTLITVGGSMVVALIGGYWMVQARRTPPGREPIPVKDLWEENRLTRKEAHDVRVENERLADVARDHEEAVIVLWRFVQRLIDAWGTFPRPIMTKRERSVVGRVIEDVSTPGEGITPPPPNLQ